MGCNTVIMADLRKRFPAAATPPGGGLPGAPAQAKFALLGNLKAPTLMAGGTTNALDLWSHQPPAGCDSPAPTDMRRRRRHCRHRHCGRTPAKQHKRQTSASDARAFARGHRALLRTAQQLRGRRS